MIRDLLYETAEIFRASHHFDPIGFCNAGHKSTSSPAILGFGNFPGNLIYLVHLIVGAFVQATAFAHQMVDFP